MLGRRSLFMTLAVVIGCAPSAAQMELETSEFHEAREVYRRGHQDHINEEARACRARGGEFGYRGLALAPLCTTRFADGGNSCLSSADCAGSCIVDLNAAPASTAAIPAGTPIIGRCTAVSPHLGCYAPVENGRAGQAICAD